MFEALFHRSREAMMIVGYDRIIGSVNRKATQFLRTQASDLVGRSCDELFPDCDLEDLFRTAELIDGWTPPVRCMSSHFEDSLLDLRMLQLNYPPDEAAFALALYQESEDRVAFRKLREDVTDATRRASIERSLRQDLEEANSKLNAFANRAAHDLRGPLRRIRQALELNRMTSADPEAVPEILLLAEDSASELERLVKDLLNYSKQTSQGVKKENVRLPELIEEAARLRAAEYNELDWLETGPDVTVRGDPGLLSIVFGNILSNAITYQSTKRPLRVCVAAEMVGAGVKISISDNGIGFRKEDTDRVFRVFERLHASGDGAGLGLATCRELIINHGWEITASGEPDVGAVFSIHIPPHDFVSWNGHGKGGLASPS